MSRADASGGRSPSRVGERPYERIARSSAGIEGACAGSDEIAETLDENGKLRGLYFDREMLPYCGSPQR